MRQYSIHHQEQNRSFGMCRNEAYTGGRSFLLTDKSSRFLRHTLYIKNIKQNIYEYTDIIIFTIYVMYTELERLDSS